MARLTLFLVLLPFIVDFILCDCPSGNKRIHVLGKISYIYEKLLGCNQHGSCDADNMYAALL